MKKILKTVLMLFVVSYTNAYGQIAVKVVTKTIEKSIPYSSSDLIQIDGENATVQVHTWVNDEVKIILKQVSKSEDKAVAEKELDYQRYVLEKFKSKKRGYENTIHLKNYFAIPKGVKSLNSVQTSEFEIWIPLKANLSINNSYGNITLDSKEGKTEINNKYGNITLENYEGDLKIGSYLGDFVGKNIEGKLSIEGNHHKVVIQEFAGELDIQSTLGDLTITKVSSFKIGKIDASKSDITLGVETLMEHQIELEVTYGDLLVPSSLEQYLTKSGVQKNELKYEPRKAERELKIKTSFGKIILQ